MFRINQNLLSINSQRHLTRTEMDMRTSIERMSSGLRINKAADDATGLFISEQMRGQIAAFKAANRNVANAVSMMQVMEGGMDQLTSMLVRMKELAIQAADGGYQDLQRINGIQVEGEELVAEMDRIIAGIKFNGITLFNPPPLAVTFQVGEYNQDRIAVGLSTMNTNVLLGAFTSRFVALGGSIGVGSSSAAFVNVNSIPNFLTQINSAIDFVVSARARVGAFQNRLQRTEANIRLQIENTTNAESVIRDADFAAETAALVRAQILVQAGTSVLNQANLLPQNVLSLLSSFG
ncbi:MAG: flagellin [Candidatus Poribacteria bacterium]|nr:flagellin [Candidatus Poribacteria bacterium]